MWKGLAAGWAGGLAASWAMGHAHRLVLDLAGGGNLQRQSEDATVKVARAVSSPVLNRELTPAEAEPLGPVVHYAFGSSVAAAYGIAAELWPAVTAGMGIPFGAAVWLGAHVVVVPALGLAPPVTRSTASFELAEFVAHLVYGGVAELIRSRLRSLSQS